MTNRERIMTGIVRKKDKVYKEGVQRQVRGLDILFVIIIRKISGFTGDGKIYSQNV